MKNENDMKLQALLLCGSILLNVYLIMKVMGRKKQDPHLKERSKYLEFMDHLGIDRKQSTKQLEEYQHSQLVEVNRQMEKYIKK
jgi:hypothetical protein